MQVVEVLSVDEKIEHVVTLSAHLKANLHPVQLGGLKELCGLKGAEQIPGKRQRKTLCRRNIFILSTMFLCFFCFVFLNTTGKKQNLSKMLTSFSGPWVVCVSGH